MEEYFHREEFNVIRKQGFNVIRGDNFSIQNNTLN